MISWAVFENTVRDDILYISRNTVPDGVLEDLETAQVILTSARASLAFALAGSVSLEHSA
jgi:hypothetical protein